MFHITMKRYIKMSLRHVGAYVKNLLLFIE
jgi:hypothetical protein